MDNNIHPENHDMGTQMIPVFKYELAEYWEPESDNSLMLITPEQNNQLFSKLGDFKSLSNISVDLANTVKTLYESETVLVADLDTYTKMLIKSGRFTFSKCKDTGELLPTIRDAKGIVKQVRLKELNLSPELSQTIGNLQTHAAIAMVMKEVELLNANVSRINQMMWNELIGESKGAWQLLMNALEVTNIEDRNSRIRNALQVATVNRNKLEENFNTELQYVLEHVKKQKFGLLVDVDGVRHIGERTDNLLRIFAVITNNARIEVAGNIILNEPQAAISSIKQYQNFLNEKKLNDDAVLYLINECASVNMQDTVEKIRRIRDGMEANRKLLSVAPELLLEDYSAVLQDSITIEVVSGEKEERKCCKKCGRPLSGLASDKKCFHCRSGFAKGTQDVMAGVVSIGGLLGALALQKGSDEGTDI